MDSIDRYTARNVANTLVDMLIDECVSKKTIIQRLKEDVDLSDEEIEYFDLKWLED